MKEEVLETGNRETDQQATASETKPGPREAEPPAEDQVTAVEAVTHDAATLEADGITTREPETVQSEAVQPEAVQPEAIQPEAVEAETPQMEIERLGEEAKSWQDRFMRARADFENFKRRAAREKQESVKYANKSILMRLLDVLDNFERALDAATDPQDSFVIGVNMIYRQLSDVLGQSGVEELDAEGKSFDPYYHEAFAQEPSDEHPENTVTEVFQKGYKFGGQLLRPAKVKVSTGPGLEEGDELQDDETVHEI